MNLIYRNLGGGSKLSFVNRAEARKRARSRLKSSLDVMKWKSRGPKR